ncbi:hypothetical protein ILYODFUR_016111 [Ilyodon furcidens]|uniref:Secreted protein n=1 Tax=Ilyodon furcidens TaxID=33524 RepID=A0ABV0V5I2_9TELE
MLISFFTLRLLSSGGKEMLGKLWVCLCKASCGCFLSGPTYLDPFTPLGPSFARFNNECRANQLSRKCTTVEEGNPFSSPLNGPSPPKELWEKALHRFTLFAQKKLVQVLCPNK